VNPTPGDEARAAFDQLTDDFAGAGVSTGSMFGMPCLKAGNKAFAGMYGDSAVFKLPAEALQRALGLPGAGLFDPSGGRPMREWAQVPLASSAEWPELAEVAHAYVAKGRGAPPG
jgi:hypothetical protein